MGRWAIVGLAFAAALVPASPNLIEHAYSRGWYATIQPPLTSLSSVLPVSSLDLLLPVALGVLAVRVARAGTTVHGWARLVADVIVAGAALYLCFLLLWGLNYRRVPLADRLDWDASRVTAAAVAEAAERAVREINGLDPAVEHRRRRPVTPALLQVELAPAFARAQRQLGANRLATPGRPKTPLISPFFRWAGVDGMINPFGLEVLVNPDALPVEQPFIVAHEWGHLAGWAAEHEAGYVGWLTCLGGDGFARYSGWLAAYLHLRRALDRSQRETLEARLLPGVRQDLRDIAARLSRAQPVIQAVSWRTYDRYLRANQVEQGVGSYDDVVRLIVGTTADADGRPRLRRPPPR
jgi:hypothetical protein